MWTSDFEVNTLFFKIGVGGVILGIGIIGVAVFMNDNLSDAFSLLTTTFVSESDDTVGDDSEKTPQTPEKLKNELYFDRADQKCEWCDEQIDNPEVHHIVPRREGGPNEPTNLIVLCPNHHRDADAGALSRSKLKAKVRRQMSEAGTV